MYRLEIKSLEELDFFSEKLAKVLDLEDVISLEGDLGAGKTSLVTYLMKHLDYDGEVTSPSFSLVNIYEGRIRVNHLDLYRLESPEEIQSFEYEDYFYPRSSVTFIEWPSKAEGFLPRGINKFKILVNPDNTRTIEIESKKYEKKLGDN